MRPTVTICGLGPGGPDRITAAATAAIESASVRLLRTARHPSAGLVPEADSFDRFYEEADSFPEVYGRIVEAVVEAADGADDRSVCYVVPGSPLVLENSVRRLLADDRIEIELVPSLSFLDEVWARLAIDPVESSVRLIDGHQFATQAAGERGPLLVAHVHAARVLSDIKLAIDGDGSQPVVVLQRLGTPDERVFEVAWADLDREVEPDHLTSLYLPELSARVAQELVRSVELMRRLRRDCPWDREQDHRSLRPYLLEETYEVLDALDAVSASASPGADGSASAEGSAYAELEEELGDLWFQILFHAELATEAGQFSIAEVAATLHDKMVRRHPHVFTDAEVAGAEELIANWDRIKQDEKQRASALDGVPGALPALSLAAKILSRAERAGVDADLGEIGQRLDEAIGPAPDTETFGRWLLAAAGLARRNGVDPEDALRHAVLAATDRFRRSEASRHPPAVDWVLG